MKSCFLLVLVATALITATAQTNYSFTNVVAGISAYSDISSSGTPVVMSNPENGASTAPQSIGFTFTYNGAAFTQFMIHADGIMRLGAAAPGNAPGISATPGSAYGNVMTSTGSSYQNVLLPFFCDLVQGTSTPEFHVLISGAAPNRVCTIQWKNLRDPDNVSGTLEHQFDNLEFQVKLYETSNDIEFVYGTFLPDANTATARFAATGIKASSSSFIALSKDASGSTYKAIEFLNPAAHAVTPNRFAFRKTNAPVPGYSIRFFGQQTNDINVAELYADDFVSKNGNIANSIRALIKNEGTAAAVSVPVTLTVTGANSYTETINIAALAAGAAQTVAFTPFAAPLTGEQTVTLSTAAASDSRTENNSKQTVQTVTAGLTQPFDYSRTSLAGLGFNGSTSMLGIKMFGQGTRKITQIRIPFVTDLQPVDIRIYEDGGTGNTPSPAALFTTAQFRTGADNEVIVAVNPAVTVTDDYFIVVAQRGTSNMGWRYVAQYPQNPQRYYRAALNGTTWTEQTSDRPFAMQIRVFEETSGVDVGVESLASPTCGTGENETVSVVLRNFTNAAHDYAANPVTISGTINDFGNNLSFPFSITKSTGTIAAGGTDVVTVFTGYNFSARNYHLFRAKTSCAGDSEPLNDSLGFYIHNRVLVTKSPVDSTCPYGSTTLTGSTTYLTNYNWSQDRNFTTLFSTASTVNVNVQANDTIFYVRATDYRNCVVTDSVTIRVKKAVPPTPVITTTDPVLSFRNGFNVLLQVPPSGSNSILWTGLGTPQNGGLDYRVSGFRLFNPELHAVAYANAGCGGLRDTILTAFAPGILLNDNNPVTVCDTSFYDIGGASGIYSGLATFAKTFTPSSPGQKMKFTVYNLSIGGSTILNVFDGTDINAPRIGRLTAADNGSTVRAFTASNPAGVLTVEIQQNGSSGNGFLAGLTCQAPLQFRTVSDGVFTNAAIWESKPVGATVYTPALRIPDKGDDTVLIRHAVTMNQEILLDQTIIENSGHLQVLAGGFLNLVKTIPGTELRVDGTLSVNSGAQVSSSSFFFPGKIALNGSLINNATVNIDTVVVTASVIPAVISGTGSINRLTVNGPQGVAVSGNLEIPQLLTLINGVVTVNAANFIRIPSGFGGIIQGGNTASYIDGRLRLATFIRNADDTLFFPVGDNGLYRRAGLLVNQTSFDFPVEYEAEMVRGTAPVRTLPGTLSNINTAWYHKISIVSGTSFFTDAAVTIDYKNGDGVLNESILRVAKDDGGTNWLDMGGTGSAPGTGIIGSAPFTSFSDFVLANISGASLPLNLLHFTGEKDNGAVRLIWETDNEVNTSHFIIERSADGIYFQALGRVNAKNRPGRQGYHFADVQPRSGANYYRLQQYDLDGRFVFSTVVLIRFDKTENDLLVFPNPAMHTISFVYPGSSHSLQVSVYDLKGRLVKEERRAAAQRMEFNIESLPPGMYQLRINDGRTMLTSRFVKQ